MASDVQSTYDKSGKRREKVSLKPGFHLADWIKLTQSANDLAGRKGQPLRKITHAELSEHQSQYDCWTAYNGKVYNISAYIAYHPGGIPKVMLGAGKDCTALFDKYHKWVNAESMLSKCLLGYLAEELIETIEEESEDSNEIDNSKAEAEATSQLQINIIGKTVAPSVDLQFDDTELATKSLKRLEVADEH